MPWLAIPYEDNVNRKKLTLLYGIQGIPTLILLNSDGSLITEDGRGEINDDPEGTVRLLMKIKIIKTHFGQVTTLMFHFSRVFRGFPSR